MVKRLEKRISLIASPGITLAYKIKIKYIMKVITSVENRENL